MLQHRGSSTDSFMAGMLKDPEEFMDFFEEVKKDYSETFNKLLKIPAMGIFRKDQEEYFRLINNYNILMINQLEFVGRILILVSKNTDKVIKDFISMYKIGGNVKTFDEFYKYWKDSLDKSMDSMFYSDEFSKLLASYMESNMDFKISMDKMLEKQLSVFPVVLKSDIRSLYKTVYDLKKEVRSLREELDELKTKTNEVNYR